MNSRKTFLVVGASGKLGAAVSRILVTSGFGVALAARNLDRIQTVASALPAGVEHHCFQLDLRDSDSVAQCCRSIDKAIERLGGVVNCAAGFFKGPFASMTEQDLSDLVRANFVGAIQLIHGLLPKLQRNAPADVVNITSISSATTLDTSKSSALHIATKAALQTADVVLGRELSPSGIRVTTVAPSTFAKEDRPGIPVEDLARLIVQVLQLPPTIRIETIAVYPNGTQS